MIIANRGRHSGGDEVMASPQERKSTLQLKRVRFSCRRNEITPVLKTSLRNGNGRNRVVPAINHSCFSCTEPQQLPGSPPQLHSPLSISLPRSAALIIAQAHPTPLCTVIACTGQLRAQAPHSMQETGAASTAVSLPGMKTPCGQTLLHIPQLMQRSGSYRSVFTR
jgi:hypothetical protein